MIPIINAEDTRMFAEAAEAPRAVAAQRDANHGQLQRISRVLRERQPRAVVTCARGSSDRAATFGRYLIETRAGVFTSSLAPSVSSVYAARRDLEGFVFLAISQSGQSPDLLASVEAARGAGAFVIALVNVEDSPLARIAHETLPLGVGPETSVAATKSYVASLAALLHLVGEWTEDPTLLQALAAAPDLLAEAWTLDWSPAVETLQDATNLYVIGRGLGLSVAQEAALKFKETCGLHAEAFSAAEVRHGPMALLRGGFPALLLSQRDETRASIDSLAADIVAYGGTLLLAGTRAPGALALPTVPAHPSLEPMLMIQSFYRMVNALAVARGHDPDRPPHLRKVTETV